MSDVQARPAVEEVVYTVDDLDRIAWTNDAWDRFAMANDAPQVRAAAVVGTVLWRHVSDDTLRGLLRQLFRRARTSKQPIFLSCRCDGIDVRRELRLEVHSPDGGTVSVRSIVTSEEPRHVPLAAEEPTALLRVCSWCNRVDADAQWLELEVAAEELQLLHGPYFPTLTHTICGECVANLQAELDQR